MLFSKTPKNQYAMQDPTTQYPRPDFSKQVQPAPGLARDMDPKPDHGEESYQGFGRLAGRKALVTGADSGIGRAAAIAFAREEADVALNYLPSEEPDAREVVALIEKAGRKAVAIPGDIRDEASCIKLVADARKALGGLDILVNVAGYQQAKESIAEITTEQFDETFKTNVYAMFWICKAAMPHLPPGASIINTASIQSYSPSPSLLDYASTKAAIVAFTKALAKQVASRGIRVNSGILCQPRPGRLSRRWPTPSSDGSPTPGVPAGAFGPRLRAILSVLAGGYRPGKRPIRRLAFDRLGLSISLGMICRSERQAAAELEAPVGELREYVRTAAVAHIDETSWWQGLDKAWLRAAVTRSVTAFAIATSREADVAKDLLGTDRRKVVIGDRLKSDTWIKRRFCRAHLDRDFRAMVDRGGESAEVGRLLPGHSERPFDWWHRVRDGTMARATLRMAAGLADHVWTIRGWITMPGVQRR